MMKKTLLTGITAAVILAAGAASVSAEEKILTTMDGLMTITLPDEGWYQITSDEDTDMFSDGDCAIKVKFYKNGETLPAIESADANHEMIYTAAASTQDYIMHVVGYVHEKADFAGVCNAINSIRVNTAEVSDDILTTPVAASEYGMIDQNYIAYVSADELNVRSTSENGSIVAVLYHGEEVRVTGSVTRNGSEIGWARIKTSSGVDGYVSTQFLNTTAVSADQKAGTAAIAGATRSGNSVSLTSENGEHVIIYEYTDGVYRDDSSNTYTQVSDIEYSRSGSSVKYLYTPGQSQSFAVDSVPDTSVIALGSSSSSSTSGVYAYNRTGNMICLQSPSGDSFINIYEDVNGRWWDINGVEFINNGGYYTTGSYDGEYYPTSDAGGSTVRNLAEDRIDVYLSGDTYSTWCSLNPDGYYYNSHGQRFTDLGGGNFVDENGNAMVNTTPNY